MRKKIYQPCSKCKGTGRTKIRQPLLETEDTKKMRDIMKRHGLKQHTLAKLLGISSGAVNGWFHQKTNLQGKIKPIYFHMLDFKGIK